MIESDSLALRLVENVDLRLFDLHLIENNLKSCTNSFIRCSFCVDKFGCLIEKTGAADTIYCEKPVCSQVNFCIRFVVCS